MDKSKTGSIIKEARLKKGYTQQELGDIVGVSNKAVSRWENGESFPDIAILDVIAQALELNVEEIVFGEKRKEASRETVEELVRVARIQERQKKRKIMACFFVISVFFLISYKAIHIFLRNGVNWHPAVYFYSLAILFAVLTAFLEKRRALTFRFTEKSVKAAVIASVLSGVYIALLMPATLWIYEGNRFLSERDVSVMDLGSMQLGPIINIQLLAVFFLNLFLMVYLVGKWWKTNEKINTGIYIMAAVSHLALAYSDLLHNLTTLTGYISVYLTNTIVIAVETGIVLLVAALWSRRQKNGKEISLEHD